MIDEKKLIEDLKLLISRSFLGETTAQSKISIGEIVTLIKKQPKIDEWVPCSEPPLNNRDVLIFDGKSYSVGYYNGKTWVNVIHPVEWQEINHTHQ